MVKSKMVLFIGAAAAVAVLVFCIFYFSDKAVIKRRFHDLAGQMAKTSPENNLLSAAKAKRIGDMFADQCRVYLPDYDVDRTFSGKDVHPYVMMARSRYKQLDIDFYDFTITFPEDGLAGVDVTAYVKAAATRKETTSEIHELFFSLKKAETGWLFTEIKSVTVLER